jgi:hypothetical protein
LTALTNEILHLWVVMQIRLLWILKLVLLPWGNRRKGYSMTYLQLKVSCTHCCPCLVGWIPFDFPCLIMLCTVFSPSDFHSLVHVYSTYSQFDVCLENLVQRSLMVTGSVICLGGNLAFNTYCLWY